MVRLFIPEGETQHGLGRRQPDPIVTDPHVINAPWRATIGAAGITGFLALVGKSRPGVFLKAIAYLSAANITISAVDMYGRREVTKAVYKMDKLDAKPPKLWERTKHWSVEDVIISGGVLGTFLALNPGALPGVYGWKRFLGAATVGAALGGYVGQRQLVRLNPQILDMIDAADRAHRNAHYDRLHQDPEAMKSLSRFGRLAFTFYTWPVIQLPLLGSSTSPDTENRTAQKSMPVHDHDRSQHALGQHTLMQIEFNQGELKGPDIEQGYRAYKDSLADRDVNAIEDWLERLKELRSTTASEAQFLWQHLALKEQEFYSLTDDDDREKDIVRRELQLLNNMAGDFASRGAILGYHIADAQKRLEQVEKRGLSDERPVAPSNPVEHDMPTDRHDGHSPQLVADQVRLNWRRQKELLGFLEQSAEMHANIQVEDGSPHEARLKAVRQNIEDLKKNVEATERLLREFEEQMRKADEHVKS